VKLEFPKLATKLAILMAFFAPPLFALLPNWFFGRNPALGTQIVLQLLYLGLPAFVLWVTIHYERLPLESIGLRRPHWSTFVSGILLWGVITYLMPLLTQPLVNALGDEGFDSGLDEIAHMPIWWRVIMGLTGGAVEETLYRGYAIERLASLTGRLWMGATISAVIFGLAHIPTWGVGFALGAALPFGIVMTMFYVWKRDLLANMIAHSGGLVVGMLSVAS